MLDQLIAREDWTEALENGPSVDVISIDYSKTFNNVSRLGLMQKLSSFGITGVVQEWIQNVSCDRRERKRVWVNGTLSEWELFENSVLQGTTLGPLHFLYVNELPLLR